MAVSFLLVCRHVVRVQIAHAEREPPHQDSTKGDCCFPDFAHVGNQHLTLRDRQCSPSCHPFITASHQGLSLKICGQNKKINEGSI